ncbi:unnamed protein product [Paramecium octaurelia]|uniref:Uncharacterized protein n=1 Tax=Paramecium octaurelia TaxID=43137 RepID=A0A8S1W277_PAROT|nr:unnamed protein product [Paramecium octaurelia]
MVDKTMNQINVGSLIKEIILRHNFILKSASKNPIAFLDNFIVCRN